jgi:CBS-domain-containing membrane protein
LSATDLQGFLGEELIHLGANVVEFLNFARKKKDSLNGGGSQRDSIVFIKLSDTFEQVVDRFCQTRVHRLFIMNNDLEITGLLSLTDVFKVLNDALKK